MMFGGRPQFVKAFRIVIWTCAAAILIDFVVLQYIHPTNGSIRRPHLASALQRHRSVGMKRHASSTDDGGQSEASSSAVEAAPVDGVGGAVRVGLAMIAAVVVAVAPMGEAQAASSSGRMGGSTSNSSRGSGGGGGGQGGGRSSYVRGTNVSIGVGPVISPYGFGSPFGFGGYGMPIPVPVPVPVLYGNSGANDGMRQQQLQDAVSDPNYKPWVGLSVGSDRDLPRSTLVVNSNATAASTATPRSINATATGTSPAAEQSPQAALPQQPPPSKQQEKDDLEAIDKELADMEKYLSDLETEEKKEEQQKK